MMMVRDFGLEQDARRLLVDEERMMVNRITALPTPR
jgi:hypothetical protein